MDKGGRTEQFRYKQNIWTLLFCFGAIMLNLLLGYLVSLSGLPLYLDTVGTVTVAALGGYLPGVAVGFVTNIVKSISDPASLYYGVLNVLIAVAAAFLAERGCFRKIRGIIVCILVFTLIGGGIGALIPWFMNELSFDSESLSGLLYGTGYFNLFISHLLSSLIMDLPDKALTVFLALFLMRIIPKRAYSFFRFQIWMQEAPEDAGKGMRGRFRVRVLSLRVKTLLVLIFSLFTVAMVGTVVSVRVYHKTILNEHTILAKGTASLAAEVLDGDRIDGWLENGGGEAYVETEKLLEKILASSPEISYIYVYRMEKEGFLVVFDIDTEDLPGAKIGSLLPYDEGFTPYIPRLRSGLEVEPFITDDEYGHLLTAAEPVFDSKGECVCYAIADVDMERLLGNERSFLMELISVFLGFFILLCAFVIWLIDYHVIYPVRSITTQIDSISANADTQKELDDHVKKLRKLNVHTGDEIEKLYQSLCRMTLSQAEQTRSIRQLSETTAKMQEGLIVTMADMVENRDSDTGAHIQKTAAYVMIIAEGLKNKAYYLEKLTPQFLSDVVRSAPLHDVGKINIPDNVLNKPGKLTPEEFEIMKTHTTAGKKIMEHAISTVRGENYLKEARNMAAYHHERWDGKGYPEGLHGEVIPLSARIMAVADVFDALTSPRVYKPAFPLEKALSILQEGSGTQFDPKCVEVFMESLTEVKIVLKKYNQDV